MTAVALGSPIDLQFKNVVLWRELTGKHEKTLRVRTRTNNKLGPHNNNYYSDPAPYNYYDMVTGQTFESRIHR